MTRGELYIRLKAKAEVKCGHGMHNPNPTIDWDEEVQEWYITDDNSGVFFYIDFCPFCGKDLREMKP